jgi:serine/threonine-protein kinase
MPGVVPPGTVLLGKYHVERVIGVGGMGAVVAARHLQLEEQVAIKFLLPATAEQPEIVQRFLREARAAIKIRSEHCVRILDVGELETGEPYMVMEYLDGQDLARLLERNGPLPIADAVDWVLQVAEALAEAHTMGIVHRDLKPANLFLTRRADGTPSLKVLDFGISKQTSAGTDVASVTNTQTLLGSPRYMSPEQMRSTRDVDARADIWALGAVVHELISGRPPFDADTMTALCAAILQDPPAPLRANRPDAPVRLEAAILRALEKERARRYQNVAELAFALAPFGTPSSAASAERIARILGVPSGTLASPVRPPMPVHAAAVTGASPLAATTGGSVTDAGVRRPATGAVLAIAGAVVALLGVGAASAVALRRHASSAAEVLHGPGGASAAGFGPSPSSPAASPAPPPTASLAEPVATPVASVPAAASAPVAEPVRSARPAPGWQRTAPAGAGTAPRGPAPPASGGNAPPRPSVSPSNPFGDDRKG